jgi:hypothetical protein
MAHYLRRGICKGSDEEIELKINNSESKSKFKIKWITKSVRNPRYIIYDFETDTSSGIHKPNLCVAYVLEVDDDHDYDKS